MMLIRFVFSAHKLGFLMLLELFDSSYISSIVHNMSTICSYISSTVQCECMTVILDLFLNATQGGILNVIMGVY